MILTAMQAYNALLALRQSDGKERRPKERKSIKAHKETIPYEVKFLMEKYHLGFDEASELLKQEFGHDQRQTKELCMTDENNSILQNEVADNANEQEKKKSISLTLEEKIKLEEKIFLEQKKRLQILKREQRMIEIGAFVESYLGTTTAEDAIKKITKFCPAAKSKEETKQINNQKPSSAKQSPKARKRVQPKRK